MRKAWMGWLITVLPAAACATDIDIHAGIEQFAWTESDDGGGWLLDEQGQRHFVGILGTNHLNRDWSIDFGGRVYSATVDFDGRAPGGQSYASQSDYNGYRLELGFARYTASRGRPDTGEWVIRFALGIDQWRRALRDAALADGTPVRGYVQRYNASFARLGASWVHREWSAGLGAKAPLYTSEEFDSGSTSYTFTPEGMLSPYASVEISLSPQWGIALDYDSYRFAKSDPDRGHAQPASEQDSYGLSIHYRF